jgi:hypothetical protein
VGKRAEATCSECYFRQAGLCALVVDAICPTFRAATRGVLVPPSHPQLVLRASAHADGDQSAT